jgi:hypothetical protein
MHYKVIAFDFGKFYSTEVFADDQGAAEALAADKMAPVLKCEPKDVMIYKVEIIQE